MDFGRNVSTNSNDDEHGTNDAMIECAKLALSRRVDKHWRFIGWGNVLNG